MAVPTVTIAQPDPISAGQAYTLYANATDATSYLWSNGETTQTILLYAPVLDKASTHIHTVEVTSASGDKASATVEVGIQPATVMEHAEHTDIVIGTPVFDDAGSVDLSTFIAAQYVIIKDSQAMITKTLTDGINKVDGKLITHVPAEEVNFSGECTHLLAVKAGATTLATHTLSGFGSASNGVITASAIADATIAATGTADSAELTAGSLTYTLTVGTSGADVTVGSTAYVAGGTSQVSAFSVTFPA